MNDILSLEGSVTRWHPWLDKPGSHHALTLWNGSGSSLSTLQAENVFHLPTVETAIEVVAGKKLYCFCEDLLDEHDIPYCHELIGHKQATPYLSRGGRIPALRVETKKKSGFFIPASTFSWHDIPGKKLLENVTLLFHLFGYEAVTLPSLSEKVLRGTLPEKLHIHRPSSMLRRNVLANHKGGRIDKTRETGVFLPLVREYDENKAYLHHSRCVPSPFLSPVIRVHPSLEQAMVYPTGWWHVRLLCHERGTIHPIQSGGINPVEGEVLDTWLWTEELTRCLDYGYTLLDIIYGYGWTEMSNFMEPWSDILWQKWEQSKDDDPHIQRMIKGMMVGLPGKFLRQPEVYKLLPLMQAKIGDIPLVMHWRDGKSKMFSDYVIRPEYDHESTALSPIGSYIVAMMRCELYDIMRKCEAHGHRVLRSYIDCISIDASQLGSNDVDFIPLGTSPGTWKVKEYRNVYAEENRFVGARKVNDWEWEDEMKAPGFSAERRVLFWKKYRRIFHESIGSM